MDHPKLELNAAEAASLDQLRSLALAFPEATETENFGHPWFRAGKRPFCIFGKDTVRGCITISFSTNKMDQPALCQMDGFWPTPYMHQHGWTTMDATKPDWGMVSDLLLDAYRHVALKRMLKALEE